MFLELMKLLVFSGNVDVGIFWSAIFISWLPLHNVRL
jgi:hypothetical protein